MGLSFLSQVTHNASLIDGTQEVGRGPEFCERVFRECPEKVVNLPNHGGRMEGASSLHIHLSKQEGLQAHSLELHVYSSSRKEQKVLDMAPGVQAEPICPAPS